MENLQRPPPMPFAKPLSLLLVAMGLAGCESLRPANPPPAQPQLAAGEHGYALLFDLMGDEKDVAKLRFIKHERSELKELIKEISRTCDETHKQLEAFGKADAGLNLKSLGLPAAEIETRKAISKTKEKALLTDKNKEFEIQLLLSQSEALMYGAHLALVTGRTERLPERARFLEKFSAGLTLLQKKVVDMLLTNYSWPESK